jgi:four helix bundle protein
VPITAKLPKQKARRILHTKLPSAKKEAKETLYWLKLLKSTNIETEPQFTHLYQETHELLLIFSKILTTCRSKIKTPGK